MTPVHCPFCGESSVSTHEGSTFRWMLAECDYCGAQGPEARIDTMTKDRDAAIEAGKRAALAEWNTRRVPLSERTALTQPELMALHDKLGGTPERPTFNETKLRWKAWQSPTS